MCRACCMKNCKEMEDFSMSIHTIYVTLKNGEARIADGNLAGAVSNLYDDMVNAIRFGIPEAEAILAATLNPAREVGADTETGSLVSGKKADFIICDEEWNLKQVYIDGIKTR